MGRKQNSTWIRELNWVHKFIRDIAVVPDMPRAEELGLLAQMGQEGSPFLIPVLNQLMDVDAEVTWSRPSRWVSFSSREKRRQARGHLMNAVGDLIIDADPDSLVYPLGARLFSAFLSPTAQTKVFKPDLYVAPCLVAFGARAPFRILRQLLRDKLGEAIRVAPAADPFARAWSQGLFKGCAAVLVNVPSGSIVLSLERKRQTESLLRKSSVAPEVKEVAADFLETAERRGYFRSTPKPSPSIL